METENHHVQRHFSGSRMPAALRGLLSNSKATTSLKLTGFARVGEASIEMLSRHILPNEGMERPVSAERTWDMTISVYGVDVVPT